MGSRRTGFGRILGPVSASSLAKIPIDKKALLLVLSSLAALCAYRFYSFWTTGFFAADEYGYYYDAVHGSIYGGRWFFGSMNIALFKVFGVSSVDSFAAMLPFYMFAWSAITVLAFYGTMKALGYDRRTVALSLFSSLVLVTFILLSLGFLTEPVGLALAMVGIYFMVRFLQGRRARERVAFPILGALAFGAAGATREPYNAFFMVGLMVVVAGLAGGKGSPLRRRKLMALSLVAFLVPASSLYVANGYATSQGSFIAQQIGQAILTNPTNSLPSVAATSTGTATVSQTTTTESVATSVTTSTGTGTGMVSQTTTRSTGTATVSQTTTTGSVATTATTSTTASNGGYPFYAKSLLLNTFAIFLGGILLGWGPIAFVLGAVGLLLMFRSLLRKRRVADLGILIMALGAMGSYLIVSFIFASDPNYLSFQNYSTIIRFSDTAIPAYFLLAPAAITYLTSRRRALAFVAVLVIFLLAAVPTYQVYASSNLGYANGNPFSLGYRSPAVLVRDYVGSHGTEAFEVVGVPYGWYFTPGVQDLTNAFVYTTSPTFPAPFLNYSSFLSYRWTDLYLYTGPGTNVTAGFIYGLFHSSPPHGPPLPFKVVSASTVIGDPRFSFQEVQLAWK